MEKRIKYIDIAKGIGILLVVIGHIVYGNNYPIPHAGRISNFIYSFHMPLFFIISGLCIKDNKRLDKKTVVSLLRAYIIPYAVWSVLYLIGFQLISMGLKLPSVFNLNDYRFVHAISNCGLAPLWFLLALFISEIIVIAIKPYVKKWGGYCLLFILAIVSIVLSYWYESIDSISLLTRNWLMGTLRIFPTTFFVLLGYLLKEALKKCEGLGVVRWVAIALMLVCQIALCLVWNEGIDVQLFALGNPWVYFIKGINGSIVILLLAQAINAKWILYLGMNTKELMILHYPPFYYSKELTVLLGKPFLFPPNNLGVFIIAVINVVICLVINTLFSRTGIWNLIMGKKKPV